MKYRYIIYYIKLLSQDKVFPNFSIISLLINSCRYIWVDKEQSIVRMQHNYLRNMKEEQDIDF